jgi:nickel-dependent lactate racemase
VTALELNTAAWYGDLGLRLELPSSWQARVHRPATGPVLTDDQIRERFENPRGQPAIAELAAGSKRPVVVVDDLNRPTPAARVMSPLLDQFEAAGIPAERVTVLLAPGTHGAPPPDGPVRKLGAEAVGRCRVAVHDCRGPTVKLGRTRYGTPVLVHPDVAAADFVVGLGGLYPNATGGYGGGTKMILGVLAFRSIATLHYTHRSMGWGTPNQTSNFRRDLDEIARIVGLRTSISIQIDADRSVVELICGDAHAYYAETVEVARAAFQAPAPNGANVVIANSHPSDLSLTFARMKGMAPIRRAPADASRVLIAACPEGLGFHGLFPFMNAPPGHRWRIRLLRARMLMEHPSQLAEKVSRRLRGVSRHAGATAAPSPHPTWLYRPPVDGAKSLPTVIPGMRVTSDWDEVVSQIAAEQEQSGREQLQAAVYECAPLQWVAP